MLLLDLPGRGRRGALITDFGRGFRPRASCCKYGIPGLYPRRVACLAREEDPGRGRSSVFGFQGGPRSPGWAPKSGRLAARQLNSMPRRRVFRDPAPPAIGVLSRAL